MFFSLFLSFLNVRCVNTEEINLSISQFSSYSLNDELVVLFYFHDKTHCYICLIISEKHFKKET